MYKQILEMVEEEAEEVDQAYIKANCDEYDFPLLEFTCNAPDYD